MKATTLELTPDEIPHVKGILRGMLATVGRNPGDIPTLLQGRPLAIAIEEIENGAVSFTLPEPAMHYFVQYFTALGAHLRGIMDSRLILSIGTKLQAAISDEKRGEI